MDRKVASDRSAALRLYRYFIYDTPVPVRVLVQQPQATRSTASAANAPLRVGTTATLALAEALFLQNQHKCVIQVPEFLQQEHLQALLAEERASAALCPLPRCFFGASHILLEEFQKRPETFPAELLSDIFLSRHQIREERRKKIELGQRTNMTLDEIQGCSWMQLE